MAAIVFSFAGMFIGGLITFLFKGFKSRKEFITSCGFQNCGYLPMNIIIFAFAGLVADRLLIYMFLFIMGFNLLMWSLVPLFLSGNLKSKFKLKVFLNPPVVATIFSLLWVAVMGQGNMPNIILDPIKQLGNASFPVAMLTLGAYLCRYKAHNPENKGPLVFCMLVKLFIFPALVLWLCCFCRFIKIISFFFFFRALCLQLYLLFL